jgi:hypothetical protein
MSGVRPETIGSIPGGSPSLYALVPRGVIVMWSGRLRDIPAGWALCDGEEGTPNLVARFVRGINSATTEPGTTGGADSKTPVQNAHSHEIPFNQNGSDLWNSAAFGTGTSRSLSFKRSGSTTSNNAAVYLSQSVTATNQALDVRPAYFELAYIMKL